MLKLFGVLAIALSSLAALVAWSPSDPGAADQQDWHAKAVALPASSPLTEHADARQAALLSSPSRPHIPGPEYLSPRIRAIIRRVSSSQGVPFLFLARLVISESSGRVLLIAGPNADGTYDLGVVGWNSAWVGWFRSPGVLGWFDPFSPEEAIDAAARWCRRLYVAFGNWEDAAAAWKVGAATVRAGGEGWEVRAIARAVGEGV